MSSIGMQELIIVLLVGGFFVIVPVAIVILLVMLLRKQKSPESPSYSELAAENERLRAEVAALRGDKN